MGKRRITRDVTSDVTPDILADPFDRLPQNIPESQGGGISIPLLSSKYGYRSVNLGDVLNHVNNSSTAYGEDPFSSAVSSNDKGNYNYPLFASRFPMPAYADIMKNQYKSASATNLQKLGGKVAMLTDPYNNYTKAMIEDAYRKDYTIRHGLELYVKFLLGKRTKTVIDVNKEFMDVNLREQLLADTFNEDEIDDAKNFCDKINKQVKFHQNMFGCTLQSLLAGRAAVAVEVNQQNIPVDLKLLNWRKLGQVYADIKTWKFLAVGYADRDNDKPFKAEELIYLPHSDYHVSPNTLYYGLSKIEGLLDISQTNRILNQEDLKEATRIAWAKNGLVIFAPNTPPSKIKKFMQNFRPGWNGTTLNVQIKTEAIDVDIPGLTGLRTSNDGVLQQGLTVPAFLMGIEDVPNRSVAEMIIHAWRESELNYSRTWLQDYLESQWYDTLLQIRFPDVDLNEMWIKAKLEFQDITFESLKDRVDALFPLVQAGYVPLRKALEIWDMPDVIDEVEAMQKEMKAQREEELEAMREQAEAQLADADTAETTGSGGVNAEGEAADTIKKPETPTTAAQKTATTTEEEEEEEEEEETEEQRKKRLAAERRKRRAGRRA